MTPLNVYLCCSFLSLMGDMLLLYALPTGLGLETKDIRMTVLMFLIPGFALYFASFLDRFVSARYSSGRRDYALLLIGVAGLEIAVALGAYVTKTALWTGILVSLFVFVYAFAKEGLPRLLYAVTIYRYFATPGEYRRAAGVDHALKILASFGGTIFAAALVRNGQWRLALLLDASTFVVLGVAILLAGKDVLTSDEAQLDSSCTTLTPDSVTWLRRISVIVPAMSAASCLFWPHLSVLAEQFGVVSAWRSTQLIALLSLPGFFVGALVGRIHIPNRFVLLALPTAYIVGGWIFLATMSPAALGLVLLLNGLIDGAYWPVDYSFRNALPPQQLVQFNARVLRNFSLCQIGGCLIVIALASTPFLRVGLLVALAIVILATISVGVLIDRRVATAALTAGVLLGGCSRTQSVQVVLPSITRDMRISPDLTYSAFAVLNETSAHIGFFSKYLMPEPQVLERYEFSMIIRSSD